MNAPVAKTCRQRRLFARFVSVCALAALALLLLPAAAHADGYSMSQTHIGATVEADGSLTVVERRQFDFDDDINGVFWEINTGSNQQGGTAGVNVLSVEEDGTAFNRVDYANKGDSGVYTVEQSDGGVKIKVFSPHESGDSAIYYVSYTMTGAVMNWSDTAELYWKFVGDGWSADSDDVEMEVYFANAAAGTAAVKGDNFRAWGHGSLTGDVSLDEDEPMVTYTIPCVHQGEFAEARIAFPSDWVPQLAASGEERMSTILSEEKEWADEANARRAHARMIAIALAVLSVVAAVAFTGTIVVLKLRRRKPKPLFQDEYFRDVPSADHPAVLSALMSWNEVPDQAYIATLMKLTDDRVIKLEQATVTKAKKGLLGREKEEQTYRVTVSDVGWKSAKGIDRMVLKVFFAGAKPDENGDRSRTFDELQHYVKQHATPVGDKLEDYQNTVKGKLADSEYVASDGIVAMVFCLVLGILIAFVPVGSIFFTDGAQANIIAAVISVPIVLVGIGVGLTFRRFTPEGAEVAARCKALKHWLEDFTRLKEAVPGDLVLWNKLLVRRWAFRGKFCVSLPRLFLPRCARPTVSTTIIPATGGTTIITATSRRWIHSMACITRASVSSRRARTARVAAEAVASRAAEAAASAEAAAERSNGRKLWDGLFSTAVGESPSPFYVPKCADPPAFARSPLHRKGQWAKNGKYEYCCRNGCINLRLITGP